GEERDEVIEKAVKAFERIEAVDTELAERLVEQGILSYDDLSVMEIADLVNTIEGLTEEQATEIVARAETLAEEQSEELPRRKGARSQVEEAVAAPVEADAGLDAEALGEADADGLAVDQDGELSDQADGRGPQAGGDGEDALPEEVADASAVETGSASPTEPSAAAEGEPSMDEGTDPESDEAGDEDIHDLALAAETSGR